MVEISNANSICFPTPPTTKSVLHRPRYYYPIPSVKFISSSYIHCVGSALLWPILVVGGVADRLIFVRQERYHGGAIDARLLYCVPQFCSSNKYYLALITFRFALPLSALAELCIESFPPNRNRCLRSTFQRSCEIRDFPMA